ncbi:hypothetical protein N7509_000946 [Penicillium cosmopolitanum]|uniref:Xylanolytic transcriptional activator regulatory domain-containing protein n=1 Tax=Penicillium cosmopolitanum TaxID=1131564 RepID=A0A9X0BEQ2_9EURO|nr:uncharacterized protein N7509_000946 [Penicillium cosmopolitanum]KAJ5414319.1 hypothetical protein N7509_000946 [Penicillium cosmopolitanum]
MQKILSYYYPDTELDVPTLRTIASECASGQLLAHPNPVKFQDTHAKMAPGTVHKSTLISEMPPQTEDDSAVQEIVQLHEEYGCMLADARGEYRYIGADAGVSFNSAVRDMKSPDGPIRGGERVIISPLRKVTLPKPTPQPGGVSGEDYLDMAKALLSDVCDEASLDSLRGLILLALASQTHAFLNSAYLYAGIAVRIAFSLGLHLDKYFTPSPVEKQHARRLWWSLDIFDQDVAHRVGKPSMIGSLENVSCKPALPLEEVFTAIDRVEAYLKAKLNSDTQPGPPTPAGYLELASSLTQLTKAMRHNLYIGPLEGGKRLTLYAFTTMLDLLREWHAGVPSYLQYDAPAPPLHRRPLCFLHLRYWNLVILSSRPFLLCSLLRREQLQQNSNSRSFEEFSDICIGAAGHSLTILQKMMDEHTLSSLLISDFYFVLDLIQILLVAFALRGSQSFLHQATNVPETLNELREWGVLSGPSDSSSAPQNQDVSGVEMEPDNGLYEAMFNLGDLTEGDIASADFGYMVGENDDLLMQQMLEF